MPIGDQTFPGGTVSAEDLRTRYTDLIREAIQRVRPNWEIVRADESPIPGGITTDIFERLMNSDWVAADITYPNLNVFYELGIRHACRPGTILLRDKNGPQPPFDIAVLRHIEYENTATGLKQLAQQLDRQITSQEQRPQEPDNELLRLAKLTGYHFQKYGAERDAEKARAIGALAKVFTDPNLAGLLQRIAAGEDVDSSEFLKAIMQSPDSMVGVLEVASAMGKKLPWDT
jgi:hypothetical protein